MVLDSRGYTLERFFPQTVEEVETILVKSVLGVEGYQARLDDAQRAAQFAQKQADSQVLVAVTINEAVGACDGRIKELAKWLVDRLNRAQVDVHVDANTVVSKSVLRAHDKGVEFVSEAISKEIKRRVRDAVLSEAKGRV
jgi:hypothetical protein